MNPKTSDPRTIGLIEMLTGWADGPLRSFVVTASPSPAHRPRVTRFGTYFPKPYQEYHHACSHQLSAARVEGYGSEGPLEGPLGVIVETRVQRPKTTKLSAPRGDADNYAKCPLDAAGSKHAGIWVDDGQIEVLGSVKRWTEQGEAEGVLMVICKMRRD
jgi:Holliday junction resolvase RusA-like endonuclease